MSLKKMRRSAQAIVTTIALCIAFPGYSHAEEVTLQDAEQALGMTFEEYEELQDRYESVVADGPKVMTESGEEDLSTRPQYSARTANPNPENFDSIAAVWYANGPGAVLGVSRGCTANYIGGKFWITAAHCVKDKDLTPIAFLEQSDGEFAGIERYYLHRDGKYDVALLKVGTGINATPFSLATKSPEVGQVLDVVGYAGKHNFASRSTVQVRQLNSNLHVDDGTIYETEFVAGAVQPLKYSTQRGDSGAAAFEKDGNVLHGVLSGGDDEEDGYADTAELVDWIHYVMKTQSSTSLQERLRAFTGGAQAKTALRVTTVVNDFNRLRGTFFSSEYSPY